MTSASVPAGPGTERVKRPLTGSVSKPITGETTTYRVGERVRVVNHYEGRCTIEDLCGMRCIVGVPLDRIDFDPSSRLALALRQIDATPAHHDAPPSAPGRGEAEGGAS